MIGEEETKEAVKRDGKEGDGEFSAETIDQTLFVITVIVIEELSKATKNASQREGEKENRCPQCQRANWIQN